MVLHSSFKIFFYWIWFSSGSKRDILASRRAMMKQALEAKIAMEKEKEASRLAELKKLREERHAREKEAKERKMKEQRVYLPIFFFFTCFIVILTLCMCTSKKKALYNPKVGKG